MRPSSSRTTRVAKLAIEQRIQENALRFTFLRPSYFMENLNHDMSPLVMEDGVLTFRRGLGPANTLQMISGPDIGYFAADAFDDPDTFGGAKIELVGPLKLRLDYRFFLLRNALLPDNQRIYAGLALAF